MTRVNLVVQVLHNLGEKYGFVDVASNFFIEWDATLATEYDDDLIRLSHLCNASPEDTWEHFSGFQGDSSSFVDWKAYEWSRGRPMCNNPGCASAPKSEPAEILKTYVRRDATVGCLRLRVGFKNCRDFDLAKCYEEKSDAAYNLLVSRRDKHTGTVCSARSTDKHRQQITTKI